MTISVLTPEKELFNGAITSVVAPGVDGEFQVLKNHAPIVSALGKGRVKIREENGNTIHFEISKGFMEVLNNEVSLLVQNVTRYHD